MTATFFFDLFSYLSDTAGQMPESPKIESRLNAVEDAAVAAYMRDKFLKNRSEFLRSVLGRFLANEGYLNQGDVASPQPPKPVSRRKKK